MCFRYSTASAFSMKLPKSIDPALKIAQKEGLTALLDFLNEFDVA